MFLLQLLTCITSAANLLTQKSAAGSWTGLGHILFITCIFQWKTYQRTQRKNILLQIIYVELYTRAKNTPFHAPPCSFVTFGILCKCLCLLQSVLWRSLCLLTCRSGREGCETLLGGWMCCQTPALGSQHRHLCQDSSLERFFFPQLQGAVAMHSENRQLS